MEMQMEMEMEPGNATYGCADYGVDLEGIYCVRKGENATISVSQDRPAGRAC
jgi:hypothetical protein